MSILYAALHTCQPPRLAEDATRKDPFMFAHAESIWPLLCTLPFHTYRLRPLATVASSCCSRLPAFDPIILCGSSVGQLTFHLGYRFVEN